LHAGALLISHAGALFIPKIQRNGLFLGIHIIGVFFFFAEKKKKQKKLVAG
jgi:hypothetical protein